MGASGDRPVVRLPARDVPVPDSVSPEARAVIAMGPLGPPPEYPALDDHDAWRALIAERDRSTMAMVASRGGRPAVRFEIIDVGGVPVHVVTPEGVAAGDRRVYLDIHGGGFIQGGGDLCRAMATGTALSMQARVWAVDYRMPPDHPYPAAVDDCLAVYRALLSDRSPQEVVVGGSSAGGGLAAAVVLRARDEGLPLPAAAVLNTPEVDLTESGDSFRTNLGLDPLLTGSSMPANLLYAGGADLRHPYLSPLFADFSAGFPPTILTTGTRDLFLSNTVLMHRALRSAGVPAELHVFEASGHGGFLGRAPEDAERLAEIRRFAERHWQGDRPPHS